MATQRTITTFFNPITHMHATSQSRPTQMGSQLHRTNGLTIYFGLLFLKDKTTCLFFLSF